MDANWSLTAATAVGVVLVLAVAVAANAAGLTGAAAVVPPLAAGIVVAAGIRLGYA
ncbi:uncharacterized protein HHUB_3080 [Halobacterium hubeiense]|uniref:Uncharacterized protein n=1 Tax=Halobacterium hubeiense TaxID=1407499 RepID=A0A0U5H760_9EURY|nr:hypothetical protein [Halobacterium hubeiense]CQH59881.1 uncharacterized protein HHUB_3080 [Halobacterium hubeiense]